MNRFRLSRHILSKGFDQDRIERVLAHPARTTNVSRYPNQRRFIGEGIAVVVDISTGVAITAYLDGVVTPLREDQRNDPAALVSARLNHPSNQNQNQNQNHTTTRNEAIR